MDWVWEVRLGARPFVFSILMWNVICYLSFVPLPYGSYTILIFFLDINILGNQEHRGWGIVHTKSKNHCSSSFKTWDMQCFDMMIFPSSLAPMFQISRLFNSLTTIGAVQNISFTHHKCTVWCQSKICCKTQLLKYLPAFGWYLYLEMTTRASCEP